ncbi:MAG: DUF4399 domain-containing protein [Bacteroidota bacterium]|jgi:hypothetical protein|nr:DUF4399 domain-containing protein [Bacteroidota bacterium]
MRKFLFVSATAVIFFAACNSGSESTASKDSMTSKATDTAAKMEEAIPPVPAIPAGAKVFFKNLKDGQTVSSPLKIEMGAEGISVDSSGHVIANSGHHHLLIDSGDSIPMGVVVPKDSLHLHFGNAQKETTIQLTPGKHRLALQFADGIHRSYGSKLSSAITVNVKK